MKTIQRKKRARIKEAEPFHRAWPRGGAGTGERKPEDGSPREEAGRDRGETGKREDSDSKEFDVERRRRIKRKSLILAQDERWRRA